MREKIIKAIIIVMIATILIVGSILLYGIIGKSINEVNNIKVNSINTNNNISSAIADINYNKDTKAIYSLIGENDNYKILENGKEIKSFAMEGVVPGEIISKSGEDLYFTMEVNGVGGWIAYKLQTYLYKLNLKTSALEKVMLAVMTFNNNNNFAFYEKDGDVYLLNFATKEIKKYILPENLQKYSIYFSFSPNSEKVAILYTNVNPDGQGNGGVYLLDIITNNVKQVIKADGIIPKVSSWYNNEPILE